MKFSFLYVKFNFVRFPGTIIVAFTLVIGHESFTSMATPWALDLKEFKYILWGVAFWYSGSVSIEVLVSSRRKILEWDLFMLLYRFRLFFVSKRTYVPRS